MSKNAPGPKIGPRNPRKWPFSGPGRPESAPWGPGGDPPRPPGPPGRSPYIDHFLIRGCVLIPRGYPMPVGRVFLGIFWGAQDFCARSPGNRPKPPGTPNPGPPGAPPGAPGAPRAPPGPPGGPKNGPQDPNFGHFQPPRPLIVAPAPPDSRVPGQFSAPAPPSAPEIASRAMPQRQKYVTLVEILHTFACKTVDLKRVLELRSHLSAAPGTETWRGLT